MKRCSRGDWRKWRLPNSGIATIGIRSEKQSMGCDLLDSAAGLTILKSLILTESLDLGAVPVGNDPSQFSPIFSIDVSAEQGGVQRPNDASGSEAMVALLHQIAVGQQKQNQLLEQLVQSNANAQKQRAAELKQWKDANPRLAGACRTAAEKLSSIQADFLEKLTDEIEDHEENMFDGEYVLNEFLDRFGPRLAHLNGVLQVLAQLGSGQQPAEEA